MKVVDLHAIQRCHTKRACCRHARRPHASALRGRGDGDAWRPCSLLDGTSPRLPSHDPHHSTRLNDDLIVLVAPTCRGRASSYRPHGADVPTQRQDDGHETDSVFRTERNQSATSRQPVCFVPAAQASIIIRIHPVCLMQQNGQN